MNTLDLLNEVCVLAMGYAMMMFHQLSNQGQLKYQVGWLAIFIFLANFTANVAFIVCQLANNLYKRYLRKWCARKKKAPKKVQKQPRIIERQFREEKEGREGSEHSGGEGRRREQSQSDPAQEQAQPLDFTQLDA